MHLRQQIVRVAILIGLVGSSAFAQRTVSVNLERMVRQAGVIVHATVAAVDPGQDQQSKQFITTVTLNIRENFYGAPQQTYTFRQYGGKANGIVFYPAGSPKYRIGQELILMLYPPSYRGLQSPVGAGQGVFTVQPNGREGGKRIANSQANRDLFKGITQKNTMARLMAAQNRAKDLPYEEFAQVVRSLVQSLKH